MTGHFKIKKIFIFFECKWPNVNSNDLCMAKLPFGHHTQTQTQTETGGYRIHVTDIYEIQRGQLFAISVKTDFVAAFQRFFLPD